VPFTSVHGTIGQDIFFFRFKQAIGLHYMLQKSKNAVIHDRVISSKIFKGDSVFSHDRGSAELFQMFFQIKTTPTVRWELGSSVKGKH
jgi:hypothetical protein